MRLKFSPGERIPGDTERTNAINVTLPSVTWIAIMSPGSGIVARGFTIGKLASKEPER